MEKLRKKTLAMVWSTKFAYLPICLLPGFAVIVYHGWPKNGLLKLVAENPSIPFKISVITVFIVKLPNFVSIAIYFRMAWIARKLNNTVSIPMDAKDLADAEKDFGGIWVGDSSTTEHEIPQQPVPLPFAIPKSNGPDPGHIMKVIRLHVIMSLIGLSFTFVTVFVCMPFYKLFNFIIQFVGIYVMPLFVICKNFRQLKNMKQYLSTKLSCQNSE